MSFLTSSFKNEINTVIKSKFNLLNENDRNWITSLTIDIIEFTSIKFRFSNISPTLVQNQFRQDNYRDLFGFLFLLLPYVDSDKLTKITSFSDIYTNKTSSSSDINTDPPRYTFTNLQYNRCNRNQNTATEIKFDRSHFLQNHTLLKQTIETISNKLYINWINIKPIDTQNSELFQITNQFYTSHNLNSTPSYSGLYIGDIYNTISNYLFSEIKNIKWIIYESDVNGKIHLDLLKEKLPLINSLNNIKWENLSDTDKSKFTKSWETLKSSYSQNTFLCKTIIIFFYKYQKDKKLSRTDKSNAPLLQNLLQNIKSSELYTYITNDLTKFRDTWYAKDIISFKNNKYSFLSSIPNPNYSKKNIYNFSKSFLILTNPKPTPLWRSLSPSEKTTILSRLNTPNNTGWFHILGILTTKLKQTPSQAQTLQNSIFTNIKQNLISIIFDVLTTNGILSDFTIHPDLSNDKYIPRNEYEKRKFIKSKLYNLVNTYQNTNYYLTNRPYSNLTLSDKKKSPTPQNYLNFILDPENSISWYLLYAMNWVSQISFYHHYLNNRVIFVTGGTGQGKSTQIPKLLLYSLKMIDFKSTAKIACTQPRIAPTVENANRISIELGTPISDDFYYIQFKYKEDKHTSDLKKLILEIQTDGMLFNTLNNPFLKTPISQDFSSTNIYDIVIIDESHEHNANMDLILTKMKYTTFHNREIKLIILSATMDDDEPTYRRYYRDINDNQIHPPNTDLSNNNLDRINVDRRMHISPPFQTTVFKITEIYDEISSTSKIINDILTTSTTGDILVFRTGSKEIRDIVEEINSDTPSNVIALPFYSNMEKHKREFIIELNKSKITIPKTIYYADPYDESVNYVPPGTYNRAIIVATNIAEASITIDSLKYVIDDGKQKMDIYDYRIRSSVLKVTDISESSRLQRKGRVGRVSDGTVYYCYKKDKMKYNVKYPQISTSDLTDVFFDLLRDSNKEEIMPSPTFKEKYTFTYEGNPTQYDYQNKTDPEPYYKTGYSFETVQDKEGKFYIVHPEEPNLKRNILGKIVNKINMDKINTFWIASFERGFLEKGYDKTSLGVKIYEFKRYMERYDFSFVLFLLYAKVYECFDEALKLVPMFSLLTDGINTLVSNEIVNGRFFVNKDQLLNLFRGKFDSDSEVILNIVNKFLMFRRMNQESLESWCKKNYLNPETMKKYGDQYEELSSLFQEETTQTKLKTIKTNQPDLYQKYLTTNTDPTENNELTSLITQEKIQTTLKTIKISRPNIPQKYLSTKIISLNCALLETYNLNIYKKINNQPVYISIYTPNFKYLYFIKKITKNIDNTLITSKPGYIVAINNREMKLSLIHSVTSNMIHDILPIYSNKNNNLKFTEEVPEKSEIGKLIVSDVDTYDKYYINKYNLLADYNETLSSLNFRKSIIL